MSLSPRAAEPLARKALLLQSAIAGLIISHEVEPQLAVEDHGSIALLRPITAAGRAWLEENCDQSGYQPFTGGTLLCEPRFVADIVAGAREAGLVIGR